MSRSFQIASISIVPLESAGGQAHSETWRRDVGSSGPCDLNRHLNQRGNVLECARPLALWGGTGSSQQLAPPMQGAALIQFR